MVETDVCLILQDLKLKHLSDITDEENDAIDLAISCVRQISYIKSIVNYQPAIQEDVFRYKAICKVLGAADTGGNGTYNWLDGLRDHLQ